MIVFGTVLLLLGLMSMAMGIYIKFNPNKDKHEYADVFDCLFIIVMPIVQAFLGFVLLAQG